MPIVTQSSSQTKTIVWMANRDQPVNGKRSKLILRKNGILVLTDADNSVIWSSSTFSEEDVEVQLLETGNLVYTHLAVTTYTDDNNILNLIYNGPQFSSVYWPSIASTVFSNGRSSYNSSRVAFLNEKGRFRSSDNLKFNASDYVIPHFLLANAQKVSTLADPSDWSKGCSPLFNLTSNPAELDFMELHHTDYYGYDLSNYGINITFETCMNACLSKCKGFGYALDDKGNAFPKAFY
ncbi:PREDICTED: putative receptor protein kinase ZmPK1 [Nelumbo nucifera]|uniref:Receptor protein kinase ZmPK1 n=1 Tax=Nelumbo nucifera TaxID=4432 RepID=A0A1U8Q134_NELNU|nr:PREDICTED: putative receptor protein kinase ZmPK1 [Nelumbo nucifera]